VATKRLLSCDCEEHVTKTIDLRVAHGEAGRFTKSDLKKLIKRRVA
jgi:hypothetical protein